jgi:hypothetical protein
MSRTQALVATACAIFFCVHANAQQATVKLTINVVKQAYGDKAVKPFPGVGVFDLLRGKGKLDGAACPDRSGQRGELSCTIPCNRDADDAMVVRVRPPSDQDALAGWVTPAPQDIRVSRCGISPASVTMRYEDARYALNEFLSKQYFASSSGSAGSGGGGKPIATTETWIDIFKQDPNLASKIAGTTATPSGKADIADLYRIATEAAKTPDLQSSKLTKEERDQASALAMWQVLSKSALLRSQINTALPPNQRAHFSFQPTTDVATYRASLMTADRLLSEIANKNPEQLRLADDIKTLKSLPSTGKEAAGAVSIIENWK